jgi:DNA-binding HxlR family transcriptional regulator
MKNHVFRSTCAIAVSVDLLGDKWSLLILRDMLLHRKSTFKEFSNSKEKIATNILTNKLQFLMQSGFIEKLDPNGTKKSTRYIATRKGICVLPLIIELYLLSIDSLDESVFNASQLAIKAEIKANRALFESGRREKYIAFLEDLQAHLKKQKSLS